MIETAPTYFKQKRTIKNALPQNLHIHNVSKNQSRKEVAENSEPMNAK